MNKNWILTLLGAFFMLKSFAATFPVSSQAEFDTAIENAITGDIIEWINGTYSDIYMDVDGAEGITIQAETSGEVIFNGASRARIRSNNTTFTGFQYIGGNILIEGSTSTIDQTIVTVDGSFVNISELNFSGYTCWKYLRIRDISQYTTVSHCNFENRLNYADQNICQIDASETQPGFHKVQYCSFKNFTGDTANDTNGDDGVEPIRTGSSSQSQFSSKTIIEYCYFTSCNGDDEIISGKASDCIYRYNTLEANEGEIVLRHGNRGVVYGNFFLNGEAGVRVREGSDHIIYNNYFSGLTDKSIDLQSSEGDVRVQNVIIAHNTFVDTQRVEFGDVDELNDPLNTTFINNISESTSSSSYYKDLPDTGGNTVNFFGNIAYDGDSLFRDDEIVEIEITDAEIASYSTPQLSLNSEGFYQLSDVSSIAIDAAVDNSIFPFPAVLDLAYDNEILLDLLSNTRDALKDVGAQEYSDTAVVAPYVTDENTGPSYETITYVPADELTANGLEDFEFTGGTNTLEVVSNIDWTASVDADWVTLSTVSGTGNATIDVITIENTDLEPRTATITLTGNDLVATVLVTQGGFVEGPDFTISDFEDFIFQGGTNLLNITASADWTISTDVSWLSLSTTEGTNSGAVAITTEPNVNAERTATITVVSEETSLSVDVVQDGNPRLLPATYIVTSAEEFEAADSAAVAGDIIEWTDGTYSDIYMDIDASNIIVRSQTPGGVIFTGASNAIIDGSEVTFTGFQYKDGNILIDGSTSTVDQTILTIDGSYNNISNINFSGYTTWKYMRLRDSAQYTNVSYCNFENRANYADQNIFQIDASATQPGFHKVQYCSFKNFTGDPVNETNGDDGVEPIRTGSSSQSEYSSRTTIEYCYFTSCNGDDEIISGKASDCVYRYNTLEGNNGEIVLRHGNRANVYGNFFINNEAGVRVREGSDHNIYNNYFSGLTDRSIQLQASTSDRVENVIIAHNTFVGTDNIDLGDLDAVNDPLNTVFINNVFQGTTSSNHFRDESGNETWFGNIMDTADDLGLAAIPASGITFADPELILNSEGYYQLSATSPVIDAAVNNSLIPFPIVEGLIYDYNAALDVTIANRDALKDVGAQEYSASVLVAPHAYEENTGPSYLMPGGEISELTVLDLENFVSVGGTNTLSVVSNVDWTIETDSDWITLSTTSGSNDGTVDITATENTSFEERTAIITLTSGDLVVTINTIQEAADELSVTETLDFETEGGINTIEVSSNLDWTTTVDADWLTLSATTGSNDATIDVTALENATVEERTATITFTGAELTDTVTVTQAPTPELLTSELLEFEIIGGTTILDITSNLDWTASTDSDWILLSTTSGSNDNSIEVSTIENTGEERTGTITITGGDLTVIVTVTQEGIPVEECTTGTNLAVNGTIVDFSEELNSRNEVSNLIDGNTNTRWSAMGLEHYAVIDLGANYKVNGIILSTYNNRDYQFIVEGSTTSATEGFFTLVDASNNEENGPISEYFETQIVRYVKLTTTGANSYRGSRTIITEFEILCGTEPEAATCETGANLATNGNVVDFSDEFFFYTADSIIDGNENTNWSAFGFPQDLVIDLGDNYNVNQVILSTYQNRDYQFILEGSNISATDGFTTLIDASNNVNFGPINTSFTTKTVRYIRLTIIGANTYNGLWTTINEIQINCAGDSIETSAKSLNTVVENQIIVYPNPVQSELKVSNAENSTIYIYDLNGTIILERNMTNETEVFDLSSLATGIYYAQIKGETKIISQKIIKE